MCDPISISLAALGGAQAVGGHQAGQYQYDAQKDVFNRNRDLANANSLTQYAALQRREMEEQMAASQALQENARRAAMARGTAVAASGASGAAGGSVGATLADIFRQELGFTAITERNTRFRAAQFGVEREGVRTGLATNLLAAMPTIAPPSYAGTALRIGGSALQAYGMHLQYAQPKPGVAAQGEYTPGFAGGPY